ncbi:YfgM family protein [Aggregatibacter actinomycetemcomitans]|uniref:YfgM family protein n=1 Tax=Aggregatibacter actinomycetemcomitans TaxID=714 RepID=UPI00197B27E1|nr:YfgM family protein [Aggregatibacter actinomycetemcomitans]MBN6064730.1 YfgM family protein [Aggregatibacter actinomycetemcomitans]MBN6081866.1 YfgM family protein [Aggregatibacter actinomycetemcomitans]MBN6084156.1 YfgM family protein [Aggregatibacter actinomycetemcomitans]
MAYTIEEEQELSAIKAWWNENYKFIIVCFVIAFGGVFGWNYWQSHQIQKIHNASTEYEQALFNYQKDPKAQAEQFDQFIKNNEKTSYAVLALLDKAKIAVENKDFPLAEKALKQAMAQSNDDILSSVSALRLASVQLQLGQLDPALESLKLVKEQAWNSAKNLLAGDIQLAKGDKEAAKRSYQQAQENAGALEQQLIQVRLNNL